MRSRTAAGSDHDELIRLNATYIQCVRSRDVGRFDEILAEDFLCSQPDGSLVDKRRFLEQVTRSATLDDLSAEDIKVRILGDIAIIHAATHYAINGETRRGRYTDVWARRNSRWLAVSAHMTR